MSKREHPGKRTGVEWVGGLVSLPARVTGEGEPYRPEVLLWLGAEGAVLGSTVGKPGEVLGLASHSLQSTVERPMFGRPHAPGRVRVASPQLADVLRAGHPGLDVVCAPTPELDPVLAAMREKLGGDATPEQSYLSPDVGPDAIGALFRAAAGLFRARPWKIVPGDQCLFSITIDELHVRDAAMSVIGQMGQSFGFILFSGIDDFEAYLDAASAMERGEEPVMMPPHFALSFERGAELGAALRKEIAEHRWEVAGADAYPLLMAIDEDLAARPPTAEEVTIAEAVALALPQILSEKKALIAAWHGGDRISRTVLARSYSGNIKVTLRVPYERAPAQREPPHDVLAALFELAQGGEKMDHEARRSLEDELVLRFVASPEAKVLSDVQSCHFVMDFAAAYFGATIATLGPVQLREIMFEIIPRKVSIDASAARWIIEENRAFYAFLEREFGLAQAGACLRVLGGDAVEKLEAALSDTSKFGMAKSLVMSGREAGFAMGTKEGIDAWMRIMQSQPLPASIRSSSSGAPSPPADPAAARATRNQRKAARKARRRNR